ncbi:PIR Superfamily Protein [Plasmodium ovale curtisi]|uniref:PIR Superfamily Protein n=1 Tax=Plasmodium ovale curtisi TaxID=864141 RepID=A0A1A8X829_PLAOA|nr:PIR Superfamily Protein [Plasmodium ovale curtisi]
MASVSSQGLGGYNVLQTSDLFSEKFYNDMNIEYDDLTNYKQQCDTLILSEKNKNEVKEICKKYLRYLDKNKTAWNVVNPEYDVCILLNYWIYYKLAYYFGLNNTDDINNAFSSFQYWWSYSINPLNIKQYSEKCKPNFELVRHSDWQKRKELYDYCVNYNLIKQTVEYFNSDCQKYYKYIEEKSYIYDHFEELCNSGGSNCPHFYYKCKDYNPNIVLSKLPCHAEMEEKKAAEQAVDMPQESRQELGSGSHEFRPGFPGIADGPHDTESTSETSGIGTKVGHSVLGIAPVLLSATALYRYTPVGSWIRKLGGYNPNNSMSDMNTGEIDEFSSYTQEPGDMLFGGTENYISYQPM